MAKWFLCCVFLLCFCTADAQGKYWVYFTDKAGSEYDPLAYLDERAIERRMREGFPLLHEGDFPVSPNYVAQIELLCDSVKMTSRWLNAACVFTSDENAAQLRQAPFVQSVEALPEAAQELAAEKLEQDIYFGYEDDLLECQTAVMGLDYLTQKKIDGSGVRVAIFDAGFTDANEQAELKRIIDAGRLLGTRDFVTGRKFKWKYSSHGTATWSNVGGASAEKRTGLASGASFFLARTERSIWEPFSEEENWIAALEWADKEGVDVINSSLGYTNKRYFKADMNGKVAPVSIAANQAAKRGILVVSSAGNEGTDGWTTIGAPADADSVLSVGGIHPETGIHTPFSSYGPTADKRMKPNVTAYGHVMACHPNGIHKTQGTSFSSPLVAGFAACLRQAFPDLTAAKLFRKIEQSSSLYPYFDYAHGYGIPQAKLAFEKPDLEKQIPTFDGTNLRLRLDWSQDFDPTYGHGQIEVECMNKTPYVYWHVENEEGYLDEYHVEKPGEGADFTIALNFPKGYIVRAIFLHQYFEYVVQ